MAQKSLLSFFKPNTLDTKRKLDNAPVDSSVQTKQSKSELSTSPHSKQNNANNVHNQESDAIQRVANGNTEKQLFPRIDDSTVEKYCSQNTDHDKECNNEQFNNVNNQNSLPQLVITHIPLKGGDLEIITNFLAAKKSKELFDWLMSLDWKSMQQSEVIMYDKVVKRPRLTKYYGVGVSGDYNCSEHPWPSELLEVKQKVEQVTNHSFNFVLLNFYRDGQDSISAHGDREIVLGQNPVIASLSLGATRDFVMRHRTLKEKKILPLFGGSLLVMRGETQQNWTHEIPKVKNGVVGPRINLTFRKILDEYVVTGKTAQTNTKNTLY